MPFNIFVASVCVATVFINLFLLGYTIKLYTEYFKDRSNLNRKG